MQVTAWSVDFSVSLHLLVIPRGFRAHTDPVLLISELTANCGQQFHGKWAKAVMVRMFNDFYNYIE